MALIPPFFLDCVVAIGIPGGNGSKRWIASGFLYGDFVRIISAEQKQYRVWLVTNRHVFQDKKAVYLRFNPAEGGPAREFDLPLKTGRKELWFAHPLRQIDVAIVPINIKLLEDQRIQHNYFRSDQHVAGRDKARELGISEGDFIYTLGFPMGLIGGERNYVIVRQGCIARISDTLAGKNNEFLIDGFIFPGNSGGPVVTKPEMVSITGTKSLSSAYLVGMVNGYVPYQDVGISPQTNRVRVTFEENSGLATAVPIDFVSEAVMQALKAGK